MVSKKKIGLESRADSSGLRKHIHIRGDHGGDARDNRRRRQRADGRRRVDHVGLDAGRHVAGIPNFGRGGRAGDGNGGQGENGECSLHVCE